MGESNYIERVITAFRKRFPAADGWILQREDPDARAPLMRHLPSMLQRSRARRSMQADLWTSVCWRDDRRGMRTRLLDAPRRLRGRGLDETEWFGEISFNWKGSPMRCRRQPAILREFYDREYALALLASKSREALEDLWDALARHKRRLFREHARILVINGSDIDRPKMAWSDLILPGEMAKEIRGEVERFLAGRNHYRDLGFPYRRGFLFIGPPGCGKTSAAKTIAANLPARFVSLQLRERIEDRDIERAFSVALAETPAILLLEDLDKLVSSKGVSVSRLLNIMDGLERPEGLLVLATANEPEKLDPALLHRPSRFDRVWHFPLPGPGERHVLIERRAKSRFSREAVRWAVEHTLGLTMACVQEVVQGAMLRGLSEGRSSIDDDLRAAVETMRGQEAGSRRASCGRNSTDSIGFQAPGAGGTGRPGAEGTRWSG